MGNSYDFRKTCCTNICREGKFDEFRDDYIIKYQQYANKVIMIQKVFRRFLAIKRLSISLLELNKHVLTSRGQNTKNNHYTESHPIEETSAIGCSKVPGYILEQNCVPRMLNRNVQKIDSSLDPFQMSEKESYMLSLAKLKKFNILYHDNSLYKGYYNKNWEREGFGVLYFPDGSKYEGFFRNNIMSGRGRQIFINGSYYEGNFSEGKANGMGKFVTPEGDVYVGGYRNDLRHGLGEEVYHDGCRYEGQFEYGKKCGKGVFIFQDNSQYEGEFSNDKFEGFGTYRWHDGRVFQGTWANGEIDGHGMFLWPDKKKYIGEYENDKKNGFGVFIWPDNRTYEGQWKDGYQTGYGRMISNGPNHQTQIEYGEWVKGKRKRIIVYSEEEEYTNIKNYIENQKEILNMKINEKIKLDN